MSDTADLSLKVELTTGSLEYVETQIKKLYDKYQNKPINISVKTDVANLLTNVNKVKGAISSLRADIADVAKAAKNIQFTVKSDAKPIQFGITVETLEKLSTKLSEMSGYASASGSAIAKNGKEALTASQAYEKLNDILTSWIDNKSTKASEVFKVEDVKEAARMVDVLRDAGVDIGNFAQKYSAISKIIMDPSASKKGLRAQLDSLRTQANGFKIVGDDIEQTADGINTSFGSISLKSSEKNSWYDKDELRGAVTYLKEFKSALSEVAQSSGVNFDSEITLLNTAISKLEEATTKRQQGTQLPLIQAADDAVQHLLLSGDKIASTMQTVKTSIQSTSSSVSSSESSVSTSVSSATEEIQKQGDAAERSAEQQINANQRIQSSSAEAAKESESSVESQVQSNEHLSQSMLNIVTMSQEASDAYQSFLKYYKDGLKHTKIRTNNHSNFTGFLTDLKRNSSGLYTPDSIDTSIDRLQKLKFVLQSLNGLNNTEQRDLFVTQLDEGIQKLEQAKLETSRETQNLLVSNVGAFTPLIEINSYLDSLDKVVERENEVSAQMQNESSSSDSLTSSEDSRVQANERLVESLSNVVTVSREAANAYNEFQEYYKDSTGNANAQSASKDATAKTLAKQYLPGLKTQDSLFTDSSIDNSIEKIKQLKSVLQSLNGLSDTSKRDSLVASLDEQISKLEQAKQIQQEYVNSDGGQSEKIHAMSQQTKLITEAGVGLRESYVGISKYLDELDVVVEKEQAVGSAMSASTTGTSQSFDNGVSSAERAGAAGEAAADRIGEAAEKNAAKVNELATAEQNVGESASSVGGARLISAAELSKMQVGETAKLNIDITDIATELTKAITAYNNAGKPVELKPDVSKITSALQDLDGKSITLAFSADGLNDIAAKVAQLVNDPGIIEIDVKSNVASEAEAAFESIDEATQKANGLKTALDQNGKFAGYVNPDLTDMQYGLITAIEDVDELESKLGDAANSYWRFGQGLKDNQDIFQLLRTSDNINTTGVLEAREAIMDLVQSVTELSDVYNMVDNPDIFTDDFKSSLMMLNEFGSTNKIFKADDFKHSMDTVFNTLRAVLEQSGAISTVVADDASEAEASAGDAAAQATTQYESQRVAIEATSQAREQDASAAESEAQAVEKVNDAVNNVGSNINSEWAEGMTSSVDAIKSSLQSLLELLNSLIEKANAEGTAFGAMFSGDGVSKIDGLIAKINSMAESLSNIKPTNLSITTEQMSSLASALKNIDNVSVSSNNAIDTTNIESSLNVIKGILQNPGSLGDVDIGINQEYFASSVNSAIEAVNGAGKTIDVSVGSLNTSKATVNNGTPVDITASDASIQGIVSSIQTGINNGLRPIDVDANITNVSEKIANIFTEPRDIQVTSSTLDAITSKVESIFSGEKVLTISSNIDDIISKVDSISGKKPSLTISSNADEIIQGISASFATLKQSTQNIFSGMSADGNQVPAVVNAIELQTSITSAISAIPESERQIKVSANVSQLKADIEKCIKDVGGQKIPVTIDASSSGSTNKSSSSSKSSSGNSSSSKTKSGQSSLSSMEDKLNAMTNQIEIFKNKSQVLRFNIDTKPLDDAITALGKVGTAWEQVKQDKANGLYSDSEYKNLASSYFVQYTEVMAEVNKQMKLLQSQNPIAQMETKLSQSSLLGAADSFNEIKDKIQQIGNVSTETQSKFQTLETLFNTFSNTGNDLEDRVRAFNTFNTMLSSVSSSVKAELDEQNNAYDTALQRLKEYNSAVKESVDVLQKKGSDSAEYTNAINKESEALSRFQTAVKGLNMNQSTMPKSWANKFANEFTSSDISVDKIFAKMQSSASGAVSSITEQMNSLGTVTDNITDKVRAMNDANTEFGNATTIQDKVLAWINLQSAITDASDAIASEATSEDTAAAQRVADINAALTAYKEYTAAVKESLNLLKTKGSSSNEYKNAAQKEQEAYNKYNTAYSKVDVSSITGDMAEKFRTETSAMESNADKVFASIKSSAESSLSGIKDRISELGSSTPDIAQKFTQMSDALAVFGDDSQAIGMRVAKYAEFLSIQEEIINAITQRETVENDADTANVQNIQNAITAYKEYAAAVKEALSALKSYGADSAEYKNAEQKKNEASNKYNTAYSKIDFNSMTGDIAEKFNAETTAMESNADKVFASMSSKASTSMEEIKSSIDGLSDSTGSVNDAFSNLSTAFMALNNTDASVEDRISAWKDFQSALTETQSAIQQEQVAESSQEEVFNQLLAAQKKLNDAKLEAQKIQISNGSDSESYQNALAIVQRLQAAYDSLSNAADNAFGGNFASTVSSEQLAQDMKLMEEYGEALEKIRAKASDNISSTASGKYTDDVDKLEVKYKSLGKTVEDIGNKFTTLRGQISIMTDEDSTLEAKQQALKNYSKTVKETTNAINNLNNNMKQQAQAKNMASGIDSWMKKYQQLGEKYAPEAVESLRNLRSQLVNGEIVPSAAKDQIKSLENTIVDAIPPVEQFTAKLKSMATSKIGYMIIGRLTMYVRQVITSLFSNIKEIDSAMAQLQIVTGESGSSLDSAFTKATASAQQFGASVTDVLDSMQTFSRLGYDMQESLDLTNAATVLSNVADTTVDDATTGLTSIIKGFSLESSDATQVADELTAVGQSYAISASELMEAFENGGSSLSAAGNTLEESMAIFAAGNASVQDASTVGTAMKTMAARIRSSTAELDDMGEEYDDLVASASDYRAEIKALSGVDIMQDENTYKSTYQILSEIAERWNDISDASQATLLEDLAGKRNTNVALSIITNLEDLSGAYDTATNAAGTAAEANAVYMDTIEAKIAQLKATFQELSADFMSSELVKGVVDGVSSILNILDSAIEHLGTFNTLLIGLGAARLFKTLPSIIKSFGADGATASIGSMIIKALTGIDTTAGEVAASVEAGAASAGAAVAGASAEAGAAVAGASAEAGAAMEGAGAAGAAAASGLQAALLPVTLALAGIIALYTGVSKHIENRRSNASSAGLDYTDEIASLEEYKDTIQEQIDIINNAGSSETAVYDAKMQLLSIQNELNSSLGTETDLVNNTAEAYNNAAEAINKYSKEQATETYRKNKQSYDEAYKKLSESSLVSAVSISGGFETMPDDMKQLLENYSSPYLSIDYDSGYDQILIKTTGDAYQAQEAIDALQVSIGNLSKDTQDSVAFEEFTRVFDAFDDQVADYIEEFDDNYQMYITLKIAQDDSASTIEDQLQNVSSKMQTAIENGSLASFADAYSTMMEDILPQVDELDDASLQSYFKNYIQDIEDQFKDYELKLELKADLEIDGSAATYIQGQLDKMFGEGGAINLDTISLLDNGITEGLTDEVVAAYNALKIIAGQEGYDTVYGLVTAYAELQDVETESAAAAEESVNAQAVAVSKLADAVDILKEAYSTLGSVESEMAVNGKLSSDSIESIISQLTDTAWDSENEQSYLDAHGYDLSDFFTTENGNLELNTEMWKQYAKAKYEALIADSKEDIADTEAKMSTLDYSDYADRQTWNEYNAHLQELQGNISVYDGLIQELENEAESLMSTFDTLSSQATTFSEIQEQLETGGASLQTVMGWIEDVPELAPYMDELMSGSENIQDVLDMLAADDYSTALTDVNARIQELVAEQSELAASGQSLSASQQQELTQLYALREAYQELIQQMTLSNKYERVIDKGMKGTEGKAEKLSKQISNLWDSNEFADARSDLVSLAKDAGVTASDILDLAEDNDYLSYLMDECGISARYLAQIFEDLGNNGEGALDGITDDAINLNKVLSQMEPYLTKADKAIEKYNNVYDSWDYDDQYESYHDVWSNYFESAYGQDYSSYIDGDEAEAIGEYGADFWRSVETLLGSGHGAESLDSVIKKMDKVGNWFKNDDNGYTFLDDLTDDISKIPGLVKDAQGETESYAKKLSDGSYKFNIDEQDFAAIAKYYGTTEEVIAACVSALGMFGDYSQYTDAELKDVVTNLDMAAESENGLLLNSQAVYNMLESMGYETWEIDQIMADMQALDGVELFDATNAEEVKSVVDEINKTDFTSDIIDTDNMTADLEKLSDYLTDTFGMGNEEVQDFIQSMGELGYSFVDAQGNVRTADEAVQTLSTDYDSLIKKGVEAQNTFKAEQGFDFDINFQTDDFGEVEGYIDTIQDGIDTITDENGQPLPGFEEEYALLLEMMDALLARQQELIDADGQGAAEYAWSQLQANNIGLEDMEIDFTVSDYDGITGQIETIQKLMDACYDDNGELTINGAENLEYLNMLMDYFLEKKEAIQTTSVLSLDASQFTGEASNAITLIQEYASAVQQKYEMEASVDFDENSEEYQQVCSHVSDLEDQIGGFDGDLLVEIGYEEGTTPDEVISGIQDNVTSSLEIPAEVDTATLLQEVATAVTSIDTTLSNLSGGNINVTVTSDTGTVAEDISAIATKAQALTNGGMPYTVNFSSNADEISESIQGAIDTINGEDGGGITVTATVDDSAVATFIETSHDASGTVTWSNDSSAVSSYSRLKKYASGKVTWYNDTTYVKTHFYATGTVKWSGTGGFSGTAHASGTANAYGTANARGNWGVKHSGTSLVGELGPELIVDPKNGSWHTVGDDGAEFSHIPAGAIVFNHKQTEALLKYGRINTRGRALANGSAFASGTAFATGGISKTNPATGKAWTSYSGYTATTKSSSSSSSSSSDSSEETNDYLDYIEILLDRIERRVSHFESLASSAYRSFDSRAENTANEMSAVREEMDAQEKARSAYLSQADAVDLDESYKQLIRDGAIQVDNITDDTLKDAIDEYKDWYEKALDAEDSLYDLSEKLGDLYKSMFDNISTQIGYIISGLDNNQSILEEYITRAENEGGTANENLYAALIANERQTIITYQKERDELIAARDKAVRDGSIEEGSEAWYEMNQSIDEINYSIEQSTTAIGEWQVAIRQLKWDKFDSCLEKIQYMNDEAEFFLDLMDDVDSYDESGNITDAGLAKMAMHVQEYDNYMAQATTYANELKTIEAQLSENPNNDALLERKQALIEAQREAITSANEEKQALQELAQDGVDAYLDALQDLIDKYKDARDSARDMYEYQRDIADKTKEVASLQKQIAAYDGDMSEESRKTVQELKVDLADAQRDLEDTQYDQFVSDMDDMLDDLYDDIEENLNNRVDDVDELLSQCIDTVNSNSSDITKTLETQADKVGYTMSESMSDLWASVNGGSTTFTEYGDNFLSRLNAITAYVETIMESTSTDGTAAAIIAQMQQNSADYHSVDDETKKQLHEENERLAESLEVVTGKTVTFNDWDGSWYIDGEKLYTSKYTTSQVARASSVDEQVASLVTSGYGSASAYTTWSGTSSSVADTVGNGVIDTDAEARAFVTEMVRELWPEYADTADEYVASMTDDELYRRAQYYADAINVTFSLPNVENYTDFMKEAQKDKNFAKLIQSISASQLQNAAVLAKNRVAF